MIDKELIHNRISKRKNQQSSYNKHSFHILSKLIILILLLGVGYFYGRTLVLKTDLNIIETSFKDYSVAVKMLSNTFKKEVLKLPLAKYLPFDLGIEPNIKEVSSTLAYLTTSNNNMYTNDTKQAVNLFKGLVVYVGDERDNHYVIISCDNGLSITYKNLNIINVNLYDRIEKNMIIGTFDEQIELSFLKDGKELTYEECLMYS